MGSLTHMILIILNLLILHGSMGPIQIFAKSTEVAIGVIIDETIRIGKEQKIATKMAAESFNGNSEHVKLSLLFRNSSATDPLQAASYAKELAEKYGVKAIIGMETWEQAVLVAQVSNQHQIPILSLAPSLSTSPQSVERWPFLIQLAGNYTEQIRCIVSMVKFYGWKKLVAVYEDDGHANIYQTLGVLFQTLQQSGAEIEYELALPSMSTMLSSSSNDPSKLILQELNKVLRYQSRVFVVLQSSLPVAGYLFKEAKQMGLLGRETAWVVTESISDLLDSVNTTFISNMEGAIGVKSYYDESGESYHDFRSKFFLEFRQEYPGEEHSQPGIHALRAYDGMTAIVNSVNKNLSNNKTGDGLLRGILSNSFRGLSGNVSFSDKGELSTPPQLRVINVVGRRYKELDFWSAAKGVFYTSGEEGELRENLINPYSDGGLKGRVDWPGGITEHIPRGWEMPLDVKPLKIGVPGRTVFEHFVKVEMTENPNMTTISGFSIDVFLEVVTILEQSYALPYEFVIFNGAYDDLVNHVANGTYDAAVGDVTILSNRSTKVDFTQPYAKSGLSMVVPFKSKDSQKALLFIKPFTIGMWFVTGGTLLYTMFVVWFLEHPSNPEFSGTWRNQLSTSLWFTFSSIFFVHRERIHSNYTRMVVGVWLLVVYVLTQSYTASFTSVLTVPILKPKFDDATWLTKTRQTVGCDGDSFVRQYLKLALGFKDENIINISSQYSYPDFFNNHTIVAAFLEVPYARVFLNQYCKSFTRSPYIYRLGGLGFVFPKGSPLAADVSKAILVLSDNGVLKSLDDKWFASSPECSKTDNDTERLSIQGFWVLYLLFGIVSMVSFLLFVAQLIKTYRRHNATDEVDSVWNKMVRVAQFYHQGKLLELASPETSSSSTQDSTIMQDEFVVLAQQQQWAYSSTPSDLTEQNLGNLSEIEMSSPVVLGQ